MNIDGLGASLLDGLAAIQMWLAGTFFVLFKDPRVAIGLSVLILALGGLVLLWIIFSKAIPASVALSRLIKLVSRTKTKEEFAQQFDTISDAMKRVRYVSHGWNEFVETLVFPETGDSELRIRNTSRPSHYLNLAAAEHTGLHLRFFHAVPNYFVGVGLILTFIGLAAGLFSATESLNAPDAQAAQEGVRELLGAATFKFLTSIAGIVSSIVIAFAYRLVAGGLEKRFDRLCDRLEERIQAITPESIAFDQYRELRKQSTQLERFNTDLAFSIATELNKLLNDTLRANISQVIEPIAATLDKMSGRFGEMNQDALHRMLGDFQNQLQGAAGTELANLAAALGSAVGPLKEVTQTVERSQQQIKETLDSAAKSLRETAASMRASIEGGTKDSMRLMTDSMGRLSTQLTDVLSAASQQLAGQLNTAGLKAADIFAPATSAVNTMVQNLDSLQNVLQAQTAALSNFHQQFLSLIDSTGKAADDLRRAGEPSQQAAQRMVATADALGRVSETVEKSHRGMHDLVTVLVKNREQLLAEWDRYAKRFEGVDRDLAGTFQSFETGARQYHDSIREFFVRIDEELNKALASLGGGVESLGNNVEELGEVMDRHAQELRQSRAEAVT